MYYMCILGRREFFKLGSVSKSWFTRLGSFDGGDGEAVGYDLGGGILFMYKILVYCENRSIFFDYSRKVEGWKNC